MHQSARFWDKTADRYARQPVADEAAYQKKLQVIREHLTPQSSVLEFGCGTGSTAIALAADAGHIHATDISARMIEIAQGKADDADINNVHFEQVSMDDLQMSEASFDVVLGMNILHLVDDPEAAVAKAYRWLKPGGVFISSTICLADSMLKLIKLAEPLMRRFGLMPGVHSLSQAGVETLLNNAGFVVEHQWRPDPRKGLFLVARKRA